MVSRSSHGGILSAGFCSCRTHSFWSLPSTTPKEDFLKYLFSAFQPFLRKLSQMTSGFFRGTLTLDHNVLLSDSCFHKVPFIFPHSTPIVCPQGLSLASSHQFFTTLAFSKPTLISKEDSASFDRACFSSHMLWRQKFLES